LWQSADADMDMTMASSPMGLRVPLFLAIWVTMMVAMMFPTAVPMILTFHKVQVGKRERGDTFVSTWVFVAAYILVWTLAGAAAYAGALAGERPLPCAQRYHRPPRRASAGRHTGRHLPANAFEGPVPLKVPHTHYLHHDIVA